ncbi:MAG: hypothetical protein QXF52_03210 [Thermoproteota archaeon]
MSNLLEKSLVMLLSIIFLGLSIVFLADQIIPMLKQVYESVIKLLATY